MTSFDGLRRFFRFVLAIIHLHCVLVCGKSITPTTPSSDTQRIQFSRKTSGCPFKATTAFFGRQTAFISNVFGFGMKKGCEKSSAPLPPTNKALSFLTSKEILLNFDPTLMTSSRSRRSHLKATTLDFSKVIAKGIDSDETKSKKGKKGGSNLEIVVIGLSHHNAGVDIREKLAIPEANWNEASNDLCSYSSISEASVLSTCNRFELYLAGKNQYEAIRDAIDYLYRRAGGTLDHVMRNN